MFNIQQAMRFAQMIQNPKQTLQSMGIPEEHLDSPNNAMQYLINNGRVTQNQVNQFSNLYNQFNKR
jgi:hypothetical protein